MFNKIVLVIAYDPGDDPYPFHEMVERVQSLFADKKNPEVHAAIQEDAENVLLVFDRGKFKKTYDNARAYGFEVGRGQPLIHKVESSPDNPFLNPEWDKDIIVPDEVQGQTFCGPTNDEAVCACGCSGYDERCPLYLHHYHGTTQVPKSHVCCKIPGRE